MGPLGLNTADKMTQKKIFLFGFGVGCGVIKSLADNIAHREGLDSLTIVTGNRSIEEILHKDYFDQLASEGNRVRVKYVVTDTGQDRYPSGYIQEHIAEYTFDDADIYICGQGVACRALEDAINTTNPKNCRFFIEDFH
jgi:NAD(P)H-flavin reductase